MNTDRHGRRRRRLLRGRRIHRRVPAVPCRSLRAAARGDRDGVPDNGRLSSTHLAPPASALVIVRSARRLRSRRRSTSRASAVAATTDHRWFHGSNARATTPPAGDLGRSPQVNAYSRQLIPLIYIMSTYAHIVFSHNIFRLSGLSGSGGFRSQSGTRRIGRKFSLQLASPDRGTRDDESVLTCRPAGNDSSVPGRSAKRDGRHSREAERTRTAGTRGTVRCGSRGSARPVGRPPQGPGVNAGVLCCHCHARRTEAERLAVWHASRS